MSRHADQVIDKQYNRPIANCQIYVYDSTGALATITADGGATLSNPFNADIYGNYAFNVATDAVYRIEYWAAKKLVYAEQVIIGTPAIFQGPPGPAGTGSGFFPLTRTSLSNGSTTQPAYLLEAGREGQFVFSSTNLSTMVTADPDQAIYVAIATDATGASGAWVRKFNGPINFQWSGAVADDNGTTGTDCYQRLVNMQTLIIARSTQQGIYRGGETLFFPKGSARGYYCSQAFNIVASFTWLGDWVATPDIGLVEGIRFPLNSAGFMNNTHQTTGYTTPGAQNTTTGYSTYFKNMSWYSGGGAVLGGGSGYTNTGNFDGFLGRARALLENCTVRGFARHGVYWPGATDGNPMLGNSNTWKMLGCVVQFNGADGVQAIGTDANGGYIDRGWMDFNGQWGFRDLSFVGNTSVNNSHFDGNGIGGNNTTDVNSIVSYPSGGQRYAIAYGQETAGQTTTPGTNSLVWIPVGTSTGGRPWVNGIVSASGGPIALRPNAGTSVANNCYTEAGQGPCQNNARGHIEDGSAAGVGGTLTLTQADSNSGKAIRNNYHPVRTTITNQDGSTTTVTFGDSTLNDARLREFRHSSWTTGDQLYERTEGVDVFGLDWNTQRLCWTTGRNPFSTNLTRAGRSTVVPYMTMPFLLKVQAYDNANEGRLLHTGSAAPLSGAGERAQGETVLNLAPAIGGISSWYCYTGGTPGSWGADYVNARAEPTVGIGYVTGAGGTAVQATSKGTGVTLNKVTGQITLSNAALAANTVVSFILTNSTIAATDCMRVNVASGAGAAGSYLVQAEAFAAGSVTISVRNLTAGSLSEALVLNFAVIKAVNA